uniref:Uncharacterized protein n=1 Tax=Parascaris equorum TaxID=6256 RepID=A0A914SJL9_PAREQ
MHRADNGHFQGLRSETCNRWDEGYLSAVCSVPCDLSLHFLKTTEEASLRQCCGHKIMDLCGK